MGSLLSSAVLLRAHERLNKPLGGVFGVIGTVANVPVHPNNINKTGLDSPMPAMMPK